MDTRRMTWLERSAYNTEQEKRQHRNRRIRNAVYAGVLSVAAWGSLVLGTNINRWVFAPELPYTVQNGDTVSDFAVGEGLTGREISTYCYFTKSANQIRVAGDRYLVGDNCEIYAGDKLLLRDIDRDGKVGKQK